MLKLQQNNFPCKTSLTGKNEMSNKFHRFLVEMKLILIKYASVYYLYILLADRY